MYTLRQTCNRKTALSSRHGDNIRLKSPPLTYLILLPVDCYSPRRTGLVFLVDFDVLRRIPPNLGNSRPTAANDCTDLKADLECVQSELKRTLSLSTLISVAPSGFLVVGSFVLKHSRLESRKMATGSDWGIIGCVLNWPYGWCWNRGCIWC